MVVVAQQMIKADLKKYLSAIDIVGNILAFDFKSETKRLLEWRS
jgi:hypothetical protein